MLITLRPEHVPYVRDEGSIVVLQGENEKGTMVRFGVDHPLANDVLADLVLRDEQVEVEIEHWQILGMADGMLKKVPENH